MTTTRDELVNNPEGLGKRADSSVPCTPQVCLLNRPVPRDPETRGRWGEILNNNWDIIEDSFIKSDERLDLLETGGAFLPTAIANRVGGNFVRNNLFGTPLTSDPTIAVEWNAQFLNQAEGFTTLDASTKVIGEHSQRVTINKITDPGSVLSLYPGVTNIVQVVPEDNHPYFESGDEPFPFGFGYVFQTLALRPDTTYTASAYGKVEAPNTSLSISVQWRIGIILKNAGGNIVKAYVSPVQTNGVGQNASSESGPDSFARNYVTFTTSDVNFIAAEMWLITEGRHDSAIGSAFFDAVQVEQADAATRVDSWAAIGDDIFVGGNLTIFGSINTSQKSFVIDSDLAVNGSVRLGDSETEDTLLVKTQSSSFLGDVDIAGRLIVGENANISSVEVNKFITRFQQDAGTGQGGNVDIQGSLTVAKDTTLGASITSTTTISGTLNTQGSLEAAGDLSVEGKLDVKRSSYFGEGTELSDLFIVDYSTLFTSGTYKSITLSEPINFFGSSRFHDNLFVNKNTVLGTDSSNTTTINGSTSISQNLAIGNNLSVDGDVTFGTSGSDKDLNFYVDDFNIISSTKASLDFNADLLLQGSLQVGSGNSDNLVVNVGNIQLGSGSTSGCNITSTLTSVSESLSVGTTLEVAGNTMMGSANITGDLITTGSVQLGTSGASMSVDAKNIVFNSSDPSHPESNLYVTGDLDIGGSTILGNDRASDTLRINARKVDIALDNTSTVGKVNIGGNPSSPGYDGAQPVGSRGGTTIHQSGDVEIAGKLTVDGIIDPVKVEISNFVGNGISSSLEIKEDGNTVFNVESDGKTSIYQSLYVTEDSEFKKKLNIKDMDIDGTLTILSGGFVDFGNSLVETFGLSLKQTGNPFTGSQTGLFVKQVGSINELFYRNSDSEELQITDGDELNFDLASDNVGTTAPIFTINTDASTGSDFKLIFDTTTQTEDVVFKGEDLANIFKKTEHIETSTGSADAGKPVKTNADGLLDNAILSIAPNLVFKTVGTDPDADFVTIAAALMSGAKRIIVISNQDFGGSPLVISGDNVHIEFNAGVTVTGTGSSLVEITGDKNKIEGGDFSTTSNATELLVVGATASKNQIRNCNFSLPVSSTTNAVHIHGDYARIDSIIDLNGGVSSTALNIEGTSTGTNYEGTILIS